MDDFTRAYNLIESIVDYFLDNDTDDRIDFFEKENEIDIDNALRIIKATNLQLEATEKEISKVISDYNDLWCKLQKRG